MLHTTRENPRRSEPPAQDLMAHPARLCAELANPPPGSLGESVLYLLEAGIPPTDIASELGDGRAPTAAPAASGASTCAAGSRERPRATAPMSPVAGCVFCMCFGPPSVPWAVPRAPCIPTIQAGSCAVAKTL